MIEVVIIVLVLILGDNVRKEFERLYVEFVQED